MWWCEHYYGRGLFVREDFARLADRLARLKGRFILTVNDTLETRAIFSAFHVEAASGHLHHRLLAREGHERRA